MSVSTTFTDFAQTTGTPSGIGALGLDVKYFLFQLVAFVIVLLVLRRWVFPRLIATLEARRQAVEQSLDQAKATEAAARKAEKQIAAQLHEARVQADEIIGAAHKESAAMLEQAEAKGRLHAEQIAREAAAQLAADVRAAQESLERETVQLVARATSYIIKEKIDARKDGQLITTALSAAKKERE